MAINPDFLAIKAVSSDVFRHILTIMVEMQPYKVIKSINLSQNVRKEKKRSTIRLETANIP